MWLRSVSPKREPTTAFLDDLEMLHARSVNIQGYGIPNPPQLKLRPSLSLRSALTSPPLKSVGNKASIRVSSIGPIIWPTPGSVHCKYCHSRWIDIPKPVYADWGFQLADLSRMRTLWAHASTLGRTHDSSSSLGPKLPPRYWLPHVYFRFRPARKNSCLAAASSSGLLDINSYLDGLEKYPKCIPRSINILSCAALASPTSRTQTFQHRNGIEDWNLHPLSLLPGVQK